MKILLMGEYSGLHSTLADGLRRLGQDVCVLSDGNEWKNYPRDIDLMRPTGGPWGGVRYVARLLRCLPRLRGYDVVQLVNPGFLRLRPEKCLYVYRYLKRHNGKVFLGAFGADHYYVRACMETDTYRYSDFKIGDRFKDTPANRETVRECLQGGTARATREIAATCDGIIACLWEYYAAYRLYHPEKLAFIPLPIDCASLPGRVRAVPRVLRFFIGIQSARSELKGTDVILPVLMELQARYPDLCRVTRVEDVPYARYVQLMDEADVQADQLYSYTPSMNSLAAMAKGLVVAGGGEPENYDILHEHELRPIVNLLPDPADIYRKLEDLVLHRERISLLSAQSMEYVRRHHDHVRVAQQYLDFWEGKRPASL